MTTPALPQNCIVLCQAEFKINDQSLIHFSKAWLLPRDAIATIDDLESAITSNLNLKLELVHTPTIYTNVVVSNVDGCSPELAQVHPIYWERLCALHAWDFVYVSVNEKVKGGAGLVYTVRVSKGRWRVEG